MKPIPAYLGDSVYAVWDGNQVWLHLQSPGTRPVLALDEGMLRALNDYWARMQLQLQLQLEPSSLDIGPTMVRASGSEP